MWGRIKPNMKEGKEGRNVKEGNSRAVLVAPVEDQEGIGLAKEILEIHKDDDTHLI